MINLMKWWLMRILGMRIPDKEIKHAPERRIIYANAARRIKQMERGEDDG